MIRRFLGWCLFAGAVQTGHAALMPDLVIINATVHTMERSVRSRKPSRSLATALSRSARPPNQSARRSRTRIIDARGQLVLPGFNDAHVHFLSAADSNSRVWICATPLRRRSLRERIRSFAAKLPARPLDHWRRLGPRTLAGDNGNSTTDQGIDRSLHAEYSGLRQPSRWSHGTCQQSGVETRRRHQHTPDPDGGLIVRDPKTGEPTGVLKDAAMSSRFGSIPDATFEEKLSAARAATEHAAKLGVTSVQDMSAGDDVGVYQEPTRRGELKTRIYAVAPLPAWEDSRRPACMRTLAATCCGLAG